MSFLDGLERGAEHEPSPAARRVSKRIAGPNARAAKSLGNDRFHFMTIALPGRGSYAEVTCAGLTPFWIGASEAG